MTVWTIRQERHVPEEEFHAYFDQALSRSQGAEIETHLSHCASCQGRRAEVAALRDRTSALLAQLTPSPVITPPPLAVLLERRSREFRFAMWRHRIQQAGRWAAGIAAAAGLGWLARTAFDPHDALPSAPIAAVGAPAPSQASQVLALAPMDSMANLDNAFPAPVPEPDAGPGAGGRRSSGPSASMPSLQLASATMDLGPVAREAAPAASEEVPEARTMPGDPFSRIWRVVQWEDALRIAGGGLPFIEGLVVVGVLMRPGASGERPTVIVTQQDPLGELVQSIEGPVDEVDGVLRIHEPDVNVSERVRTPPDYVEQLGGGLRRTLRMLAITGRLPADSLNALARMATIR